MSFLNNNFFLFLLVIIPILFYTYRDIVIYRRNKQERDDHEKKYIETEQRVYKMMKDMQKTRIEVVDNLEKLKDQMIKSSKTGRPDVLMKRKEASSNNEEKEET